MIQFDNCVTYFKKVILEELKEHNIKAFIAGGAVRDYFMGKKITNDYDIFFENEKQYLKAEKHFKDSDKTKIIFENDNALKIIYNGLKFDLIKIYFETPQKAIDTFDFTASMLAVDYNTVYHGVTTFIDLSKRQLIFNDIKFPTSTFKRTLRYYDKGFRMCDGEMLRLINAIKREKIKTSVSDDSDNSEPDFSSYADLSAID